MHEWFTLYPKKPITVAWVAAKLGIDAAHLREVIKGNRNTTRRMVEDVAAVLELPYDYVTGGSSGWFWFPVPKHMIGKGKINET